MSRSLLLHVLENLGISLEEARTTFSDDFNIEVDHRDRTVVYTITGRVSMDRLVSIEDRTAPELFPGTIAALNRIGISASQAGVDMRKAAETLRALNEVGSIAAESDDKEENNIVRKIKFNSTKRGQND